MGHKDLCINWIERHKYRRYDERWQKCDDNGNPVSETVCETEEELEDLLWDEAIKLSIADL